MCESQNKIIAIIAKQLAGTTELLRKRERSPKGKRVQLEGVSVYSTASSPRDGGGADRETPEWTAT